MIRAGIKTPHCLNCVSNPGDAYGLYLADPPVIDPLSGFALDLSYFR
jgi:hypothetical protein